VSANPKRYISRGPKRNHTSFAGRVAPSSAKRQLGQLGLLGPLGPLDRWTAGLPKPWRSSIWDMTKIQVLAKAASILFSINNKGKC